MSGLPSISADGRFVAFVSAASNLVSGDTNGAQDIFVRDMQSGLVTRESVSSSGVQGNAGCEGPVISANGRYVAFASHASNLDSADTDTVIDVFLRDRQTGQTKCVSASFVSGSGPAISADGRFVAFTDSQIRVFDRLSGQVMLASKSTTGVPGDGGSSGASISGDGRFVAFYSDAKNLVADDTNLTGDAFVHDRQTGRTTRISVSSSGEQASGGSDFPSISAEGRFVAFASRAANLVANDTNGWYDVFVHDQLTGQTTRVSVSSSGTQGNNDSIGRPSISADGRSVAFYSLAKNLVSGGSSPVGDVFVHDILTGQTSCASISAGGQRGNSDSREPSSSADGRFVTFESQATNLVAGDTNNCNDVFVRELASLHFSLVSLAVSPGAVRGGTESSGTVTLAASAPTGGAVISLLSSNSSQASVPTFVVVSAGTTSFSFPIYTSGVNTNTVVTVSAIGGGNTHSATLTVQQALPLMVTTAVPSIVGGNQTTGNVTLAGLAGPTQALVRMTDNSPCIATSMYCVVPPNQGSGSFTIWTYGVSNATPVTITAYYNGVTRTTSLTVLSASLERLWISPTSVVGGNPTTGNVKLDGKAPSGGVSVSLASAEPSVASLAGSISVPYGANLNTFPITTFGVDATKSITVTATALGATKTAAVQVRPATLSSISLHSSTIQGGATTVATVTMNGKTGPLGRKIWLSSNSPKVILPPNVNVPPQNVSWTFNVLSQSVGSNTTVTIKATQGAVIRTVDITLTP